MTKNLKVIDNKLLASVIKEAKEHPRLRMNYNIHENLEDNVQQLLNALEPGTDLPIHRHKSTSETYIILKGSLIVKFYDNNKKMTSSLELKCQSENIGVNIPANQWHTIEVLESGTVIFEVKEGPYKPNDRNDIMILD
ncbi:MAG: WbuC family cupin fold metalloprotein [Paludibacter sp.]|nr:WbuC family cupin fold metalloprotein [Paludibacter sp.]